MTETTLLIDQSPGETRAALLQDGALLQVDHFRIHEPALTGALFHGRVRRIEPGISAAFVDLDGEHEGFLRARAIKGRPKGAPIASLLQEGAAILVRVASEAPEGGNKLPRLATLSETEADTLLAGRDRPDAPACVDAGPSPIARIVSEHGAAADRIICNAGLLKQSVELELAAIGRAVGVEHTAGDLFEMFGVEAEIEAALATGLAVPGGATLIFEPGETLCAIDVNSAGYGSVSGRTARDVNLAAVPVIARQLRLREIAGAVVVDFLKMDRAGDRDAVLAALRTALAHDPAVCHVLGLSRLGLVEITRQRRKPSLAARLLQEAAAPAVRPSVTACRILRDLATRARRGDAGFSVSAAPAVADLLEGRMSSALAESLSWSHAGAVIERDAGWPVDRYEIRTLKAGDTGQP